MTKAKNMKEYFVEVFKIEGYVHKLCEKIETLRARQTSGSGGFGLGVQKSRNYKRGEDLSVTILELEDEAAKAKMSLLRLERDIRGLSCSLQDPMQRAIIIWRYICRLKWKDIAKRAEMSEMHVLREHNAAMEALMMDVAGDVAG
ncbi:MAG: hypothetical protein FWC76_08465 [Defluviitaleaceae bacterium]|nr:hypothetical protein [Defluviitaleaceae bacterium]